MKRILVVEDDPGSRDLLREILHMAGYDVICSEDGGDALEQLTQAKPDLVLLDIEIPVLDGYEVLNKIRQSSAFSGLPVCAVTARAMLGERQKALASGFDAYITKPIDPDNLIAQVAFAIVTSSAGVPENAQERTGR